MYNRVLVRIENANEYLKHGFVISKEETDNSEYVYLVQDIKDKLRTIRQREWFSVIDSKGLLWIDTLEPFKQQAIKKKHQEWLDITISYKIPDKLPFEI